MINDNLFEIPKGPKIETIRTAGGNEASFSPERGGIISSLKIRDNELLYMDMETLNNQAVNVKGGIPILFPNAGPIMSADFPGLKQHGYARSSSWETEPTSNDRSFSELLRSSDESKTMYPYDVELRIRGEFEDDGSFSLHQEATNRESANDAPVSMGLHPYFKVPHEKKGEIKFDFEGGEAIEAAVEQWANGNSVSVDNPKIHDPEAVLRITLPSVGTLTIDVSSVYKKIWIWSLADKDFVCIEPVMRDAGGLADDPEKIAAGETLSARTNIQFEN